MADLNHIFARCDVVGDCQVWQGRICKWGYGHVRWEGRMRVVHRVVYEQLIGPVPEGLELDHLCRNRACCNVDHLEAVTHAENMRRASEAQTACRRAGHDYSDPRNVYIDRGKRRCAECHRQDDQARKMRETETSG